MANNIAPLLSRADSLSKQHSKKVLPVLYQCQKYIKYGHATNTQKVRVYKLFSKYFLKQELLDSAYTYCNLRLEYAEKSNQTDDIILAKTDLGEIYGKKGNYKKALKLLTEARELSKLSGDPTFKANILTNQAYLYYSFEKKRQCVTLLREALKIYRQQKDSVNMSYMNNNIGILYKHQLKYDSAVFYLNQAYLLAKHSKDTLGMASACNNMGITLALGKNNKDAEKYLQKSLRYYNQLDREELSLYSNLGHVYKELGKRNESIKYLNKAIQLAMNLDEPQKTLSLLKEVSDFYRDIKDWRNSLYYMNEYHKYKEMVYQKELPEIIDRIKAEADLKIKEKTIQLLTEKNNYQALYLKHKNILIVVLISLIIAVICLAYNLHARNKIENKRKELLMEQRLLRSQMNPHFFFNTLTTLQTFVINNEARLAGKYIAKFAKLMREILENSTKSRISLDKEIEALENYLTLQQIRLNNNFDFHIHIDEEIDDHSIAIPPMLIQPFIENAIEHGLKHLTLKEGELNIHFSVENDLLNVVICDNGIGRTKSSQINSLLRKDHNSLGAKITNERLELITNDKKKKSRLIIYDLYDQNQEAAGTKVELKILFEKFR
jgi:tetratricopeptide (TPR) repeat protein